MVTSMIGQERGSVDPVMKNATPLPSSSPGREGSGVADPWWSSGGVSLLRRVPGDEAKVMTEEMAWMQLSPGEDDSRPFYGDRCIDLSPKGKHRKKRLEFQTSDSLDGSTSE